MSAPLPSMFLAGILSAMPDLWRRMLGVHSPDAFGCCMACRDSTGAASWPCLPHAIAEFARHIAGTAPEAAPADDPAGSETVDAGILAEAA